MPQANSNREDAKAQLISAGIGDRFLELKLSDFGELGTRWLAAVSPKNVRVAKPLLTHGFLLYVSGKGAREFAHTLSAGLLMVYKARVECLHLSDLSDALDNRETERIDALQGCDVLTVSEFLNTGSNPLGPRSAFRVESFLLERTETQGKTLVLLGEGDITQSKWWTPRIITRIQDAFLKESVIKYAHPAASQAIPRASLRTRP